MAMFHFRLKYDKKPNGTKIYSIKTLSPILSPTHAKSIQDVTKVGFRLPTLSQLPVVRSESKGTDLLLPNDESCVLDEFTKEYYISIAKKHLPNAVFSMLIIFPFGHTMTPKNFSKPLTSTRESAIGVTWKLNLPCLTN